MTLNEAFKHLLQNVDKTKVKKTTHATWKRRFEKGEISYESMHRILKANGYKCLSVVETWKKADE